MAGLMFYKDAMAQVCPDCVVALVGNKLDLVDSRRVSFDDGFQFSPKVGATFYTECSAKTGVGVPDLFQFLARQAAQAAAPAPVLMINAESETTKCC
jgi:GTPase SAR1 family protein